MGVYRRGKIWYIRYQDPDGKLCRESTGQESKRTALDILRKRKTEVAEGKFLDRQERPDMTFSELCDWYWEHHGRTRRWHGIPGMLKRFRRFFGDRPLTTVSPELISDFVRLRKARDGVRPSTVNKDLQLLKSMFNLVIGYRRWGKVLENPVRYVKLTPERHQRVRFLDETEIRRLLNACDGHLRPIVTVALRTGMRRGEILALRWSDVDLSKRLLLIRLSKNGESRHVPMSDDLFQVLVSLESRGAGGYVFPSRLPRRSDGTDSDNDRPLVDIKNSFRAALDRAHIRDFRFHELRYVLT